MASTYNWVDSKICAGEIWSATAISRRRAQQARRFTVTRAGVDSYMYSKEARMDFRRVMVGGVVLLAAGSLVRGRIQPADNPAVAEPEFADIFYRLGTGGQLIPLERQTTALHRKQVGIIVTSMEARSEVPGGQSPVRFHAEERLVFVVRTPVAGTAVDPPAHYTLHKLDKKKNKREMVIMTGYTQDQRGRTRARRICPKPPSDLTHGLLLRRRSV
jgi:hypothetical protein